MPHSTLMCLLILQKVCTHMLLNMPSVRKPKVLHGLPNGLLFVNRLELPFGL